MSAQYKKRFEAYFLSKHPKGPKWTAVKTAKYLGATNNFVRRWANRCEQTGNVDDEAGRGRKRTTTKRQDRMIVNLFLKNPSMMLRRARKILSERSVIVSLNMIRQRLMENMVSHKSTVRKPLLTGKQVKKRLEWARQNIDRDWNKVIFTDESSFWLFKPIKRVWCKEGEKFVQRTVKHPAKVHVYGCFSAQGFGKLICFTKNLNAELMLELYKSGLLKSAEKLYGKDNRDWILQEDNDPKHRSRLCTRWKENNGVTTMDWPSQSPDANPIENVWALMKLQIAGKNLKTTKDLIRKLKKIWGSFTLDYAEKLAESCQRRCQLIIDNGGDWTTY